MKGLVLTDLIDVQLLQKIQDEFSRYTGLASLITDVDGKPITEGSGFCAFCMEHTRGSEEGYRQCVECDKKAPRKALKNGKPIVYRCHAGLADFAAPIMVGERLVGCCLGGQVRIDETPQIDLQKKAEELGIDAEGYYKAFYEVSLMKEEEIQRAAEFLGIIANVLSEMAYQNYMSLEKYRQLERAARSQSRFLMNLSSDLHTNMNEWITGLQESVKSGNVESVMAVIDTMLQQGSSSYSIIGDIVDYMKFYNDNVALYEQPYRIHDILEAVKELEEEEAKEKQAELVFEVSPEVPQQLFGDSGRISQMLVKMVSNGLQSMEPKEGNEVRIAVSVRKISYAYRLILTVRDTGRGLTEEQLEETREFFSRGLLRQETEEENIEYKVSIVDLYVRQMHGTISLESRLGEGTEVRIELPQLSVKES